jgi:hypothetical protein
MNISRNTQLDVAMCNESKKDIAERKYLQRFWKKRLKSRSCTKNMTTAACFSEEVALRHH